MASDYMISRVKTDLRITHQALDGDIADSIDACLADLRICGVPVDTDGDPAILNLVKLWSRAFYTDDPEKHAVYMDRYGTMKATLMMAEGYGGGGSDD